MSEHPPAYANPKKSHSYQPNSLKSEHIRNTVMDIVITVLTCTLFSLYVQHRQILAVNAMVGSRKYSFLVWFLLSIITCGLYHFYHEYLKSADIAQVMGDENTVEPILHLLLNVFAVKLIADALQQEQINRFFEGKVRGNEARP